MLAGHSQISYGTMRLSAIHHNTMRNTTQFHLESIAFFLDNSFHFSLFTFDSSPSWSTAAGTAPPSTWPPEGSGRG